jgi:hypothetical protein
VTEIELTTFAAYRVQRGWAALGPVKTASRIDRPLPFARPAAGAVRVAGVAWAQGRGIAAVEVQVGDGPWQAATVLPAPTLPAPTLPVSTLPVSTLPVSTLPVSTLPVSTLPAPTLPAPTNDTWVQWRRDWAATPGNHLLRVRATDKTGAVQTPDRVTPFPDGATGWHNVT